MGVGTEVKVQEYLNTCYSPDVEYVDGALVERNVGDWLHSLVQSNIIFALRRKYPHLKVVGELRSKVTETRYYLPDVCAVLHAPETAYLLDAPFLAVEILSAKDSMTAMMEKLQDYENKGVPNIWLIDPRRQRISVYQSGNLIEVKGDVIVTTEPRCELTRAEIFQQ